MPQPRLPMGSGGRAQYNGQVAAATFRDRRLEAWRRLRLGLRLHTRRLTRFCAVGASGVVVNSAVLIGLVEVLHLRPVVAGAIATECAIISNFLLNDRWTFADGHDRAPWLQRLAWYNSLTLGGLVLSVAVLGVLYQLAGLHYLIANVGAICASTLWNYGSNHRWTWTCPGSP
jgi:putative flippase GtrA